jgi:hypothetical protein
LRDAWSRAQFKAWTADIKNKLERKYRNTLTAMKENTRAEAAELFLFLQNEQSLHAQKEAIIKNMKRKVAKGTYNSALAVKGWLYLVNDAAKAYFKQFGTKFSPAVRKAVANMLASEYDPKELANYESTNTGVEIAWDDLFEKKKPFRIRPTAEGDILYKQWKKWSGGRQYEPEFFRLGARYLNFYSDGGKNPNRSFVWIEQYGGENNYRVVATTENGAIRYKDFKDLKSAWGYANSLKSGRTFMKYVHGVGDDATKEVPAWTQNTYTRWLANFRRQVEALQKSPDERARIRGEKRESVLDISIVIEAIVDGGIGVAEVVEIASDAA